MTWNIWKTGCNWTTAGARGSGDSVAGFWWQLAITTTDCTDVFRDSTCCCCGACKLKDELVNAICSNSGRFDFIQKMCDTAEACCCLDGFTSWASKDCRGSDNHRHSKLEFDYTACACQCCGTLKTLTGKANIAGGGAAVSRRRGAVV